MGLSIAEKDDSRARVSLLGQQWRVSALVVLYPVDTRARFRVGCTILLIPVRIFLILDDIAKYFAEIRC